jgi:hypothetical protein
MMSLILICTMEMGVLGTEPLTVEIDEPKRTATIATTTCPLKKSSALKFVIHCTANDGAVITYVIDRVTGEILAETQAPSLVKPVILIGKCEITEKLF